MAFIVNFEVQDLASKTGPTACSLDRHLNIFWGLNGTGKTSLLKILHSAMLNDASVLDTVPFSSAKVEFYSENFDAVFERYITKDAAEAKKKNSVTRSYFMNVDGDTEIVYARQEPTEWTTTRKSPPTRKSSTATKSRRLLPQRMKHGYLDISRLVGASTDQRLRVGPQGTVSDDYFDLLFARQVQRRWQAYHSLALENIQQIQQRGIGEVLSILFGDLPESEGGNARKVPPAAEAFELVAKFMNDQRVQIRFSPDSFASRYRKDPKLRQIVARIEAVFEDRELALRPQRELKSVIERLYSGNKHLEFDGHDGISVHVGTEQSGVKIPIAQLSAGERQLLRILLETMMAEKHTVLIDEPELSMHVDWQRQLVSAMQLVNPDCQLILATHSPEVMALVPDENIFEL